MGVQAVLAVLLLFTATVKADEGVTFWREKFTMTCPQTGTWFKKQEITQFAEGKDVTLKYDGKAKGLYHCEYKEEEKTDTTKYYFYVKGKVCADCFELNAALFWGIIVADLMMTAFLMIIIYRFTKKKSSAGLTHASKAPARSGGQAPPVPSPDYEPLNAHTRSQDAYDTVNRTG